MAESRRKVGLFHYSTAAKMFNNYLKNGSFEEAERSGRLMESNEKDRLQNRRWLKNGNTLSLEKMKVLFDSFSKKKTIHENTLRSELNRRGITGRGAA